MISPTALTPALTGHLPRQRWFGAKDRPIAVARVDHLEVLREPWPALMRIEVLVADAGEDEPTRWQVFLGLRPTGADCEFLTGHEAAVLGEFETTRGPALAYDALVDPELALVLLSVATPDHRAGNVRPVIADQSNTSLIFDDAVILKLFRRLADGPNPEAEVTEALSRVGFKSVALPLARWRSGPAGSRDTGRDLGLAQEFLAGGIEGWALALTSLRELYADPTDPADSGADFAAEAGRLGEVTAALHRALADAFGTSPADPQAWSALMQAQVDRVLPGPDDAFAPAAHALIDRLKGLPDVGAAIRVHGDYHLGQVMRTDAGWYVLDFEGEPARPLAERRTPTSPLKDVAGMLRSLGYAPAVAMATQDEDRSGLGLAWEARNRSRFLAAYRDAMAGSGLVPDDDVAFDTLLGAFELDKAVYEVAYERAHRPEFTPIPTRALRRLLALPAEAK